MPETREQAAERQRQEALGMAYRAGVEQLRLAVLRLVAGDFELEAEVRRLQVPELNAVKSGEETPRSK